MQQNDRGTVGGTGFGVADVEEAGIDLFQRRERCVRPGLEPWEIGRPCLFGLCLRGTGQAKLGGRDGHGSSAKKASAILVDLFRHCESPY